MIIMPAVTECFLTSGTMPRLSHILFNTHNISIMSIYYCYSHWHGILRIKGFCGLPELINLNDIPVSHSNLSHFKTCILNHCCKYSHVKMHNSNLLTFLCFKNVEGLGIIFSCIYLFWVSWYLYRAYPAKP